MSDDKGQGKPLSNTIFEKVRQIVRELEDSEAKSLDRNPGGEIEIKIGSDQIMWYVAYRTST